VLYEGVASPLANRKGGDIDMVIVRENTEASMLRSVICVPHQPEEVAIQTSVFTRAASSASSDSHSSWPSAATRSAG